LDAILSGVNENDADDIASLIENRPHPTSEEWMAAHSPTRRPDSSRDLFEID
jgi:hypothetical protein